jgi:hypothetical protein
MLCLPNVSHQTQALTLPAGHWRDLLGAYQSLSGEITLPAYGVMWLLRK